jgi:hypothetical protein
MPEIAASHESVWMRRSLWEAYAGVFAPLAFVAPLVGAGDDMVVIARKRAS